MIRDRYNWIATKYGNRYWWFHRSGNNYLPAIYKNLSDSQWELLKEWYEWTDTNNLAGECNIPAMSQMIGTVDGNNLDKIVQIGHFSGWSTLMLGWALQAMGKKRALVTFDIKHNMTQITRRWVTAAGLDDVVSVLTMSGSSPQAVELAVDYLTGSPKMIFIDSSHNFQETLDELYLWIPELLQGGVIFLHDVSIFAQRYDKTGKRGVHDAVETVEHSLSGIDVISFNRVIEGKESEVKVLQDGCGLGIIQKWA